MPYPALFPVMRNRLIFKIICIGYEFDTRTDNSNFYFLLWRTVKQREGVGLRGMCELLIRFLSHQHTHLEGGNTPHSVSIAPPPGGLHGL